MADRGKEGGGTSGTHIQGPVFTFSPLILPVYHVTVLQVLLQFTREQVAVRPSTNISDETTKFYSYGTTHSAPPPPPQGWPTRGGVSADEKVWWLVCSTVDRQVDVLNLPCIPEHYAPPPWPMTV